MFWVLIRQGESRQSDSKELIKHTNVGFHGERLSLTCKYYI